MNHSKSSSSRSGSKRTSGQSRRGSSGQSRRSSSQSRTNAPLVRLTPRQWAIIGGILLIATAGIATLSGLSISRGKVTDWLWDGIWTTFGYGGVIIPPVLGLVGLYLVLWGMEQSPQMRWDRAAGGGVLLLGSEGALHILFLVRHPAATAYQPNALQEGGGYLGAIIVTALEAAVGRVGAAVLCFALMGIGVVMVSHLTFAQVGQRLALAYRSWQERRKTRRGTTMVTPIASRPPLRAKPQLAGQPEASGPEPPPEAAKDAEAPLDLSQPGLFYGDAVRMAAANYQWEMPKLQDILEPGTENASADAQIREQVEIIEHTLASFGVPGRVVEINPGPVITQFGVEPQYIEQRNGRRVKVKVGQINSLADDLALALAARSIRIEAPVPGKGYVGIEVPNSEASIVSLRDVMEANTFAALKSALRIGLGEDVSGNAIAADLTQMPHLLIAGTTGAGKSVCVNSIITCLLLNNSPTQLRLLMVDPKRVELTGYNGIPHLLTPVIVDLDKVVGTLQWVSREMDTRYRRFAEAGARNIAEFNRQADKDGEEKLPYIVVVIDELADLMLMAPDETERTICRLAQMARATGIHLIIATQRPSVDVVTGLIKANFPARIAFAVASSIDSRVILDTTGAERLLGRGDMLLMTPDTAQPTRMQGCYVSDTELRRLVDYWRRQRAAAVLAGKAAREEAEDETTEGDAAEEEPTVPAAQQPLWEEMAQLAQQSSQKDELLDEAIAIVREIDKASVSLLQRRLRIGYTRAARLIDEMEAMGVVGPHPGGSRQREVLPAPEAETGAESGLP